jgi:predicted MFS family arabinose efflux permease
MVKNVPIKTNTNENTHFDSINWKKIFKIGMVCLLTCLTVYKTQVLSLNFVNHFLIFSALFYSVFYEKFNVIIFLVVFLMQWNFFFIPPVVLTALALINHIFNVKKHVSLISSFLISFGFSLLIPLAEIQPIISIFIGSLIFIGIDEFKKSDMFFTITSNKNNLNRFFIILSVILLLVLGRFNDAIFYERALQLGLSKSVTILLFVQIYTTITLSSFLFSYLLGKNRVSISSFIMIASLIISNLMLVFSKSYFDVFISLFFLGIYSSGVEVIGPTLIASTIPSPDVRGTILGFVQTVMGITTLLNASVAAFFITKYGIAFAAGVISIFPLISLFVFLIFSMRILNK